MQTDQNIKHILVVFWFEEWNIKVFLLKPIVMKDLFHKILEVLDNKKRQVEKGL